MSSVIRCLKIAAALDGVDYFRVEFVADATGKITEIVGHYDNGMSDSHPRKQ
jgi:hypothetical protein